ncbi:C40 family peptidase [Carboxydothermus ferrireducens]|uniref:Peptidoglycan endopeptidase LytE n=1 Tax=Carboxydothermus ferrireducens DSM 11255 TaxID=1119529 RepID=A0ABX2R7K6_9THEO|nr:C40 family peptidase [Carboxydothermus ferrireducens]NYE56542.1 peptidoglycan endopeptidase LytE [Carboxydothermus ferrireducens DSM 11255]
MNLKKSLATLTLSVFLLQSSAWATTITVKSGDNLWLLARRYNTTVEAIKKANNLKSEALKPGQKLVIPGKSTATAVSRSSSGSSVYIVKAGDTLWDIAKKFNLTVDELKRLNNLKSEKLSIGQKLLVKKTTSRNSPRPKARTTKKVSRGEGRGDVVKIALSYLGTPYQWGASSGSAFDCSGFTAFVYRQVGINLPHNSLAQYEVGEKIDKSELSPGDLVFFKTQGSSVINHVGIYIGDGQFIHASSGKDRVIISSLREGYYASRYAGAVRVR